MLRLGICTEAQYVHEGEGRRFSGPRAAYSLLDIGDCPTEEQTRVFEDVSFTLFTSNGTARTTFRERFHDVDAVAMRWIEQLISAGIELRVQDRAASHGLTSLEWARQLFRVFPRLEFEASDTLLYLIELSLAAGGTYILEPNGEPLQYIKPPFVVSIRHPEPWRYPVNRFIAARARRRFQRLRLPAGWMESAGSAGYQVGKISCIHPEVRLFMQQDPRFRFRERSVFEHALASCHVLRTMNILNRAYFSTRQLAEGVNAAFHSVKPGGLWIVGRTLEQDFSNHVTVFRRREHGWEVLERIGDGWEMEALALRAPLTHSPGTAR
jgi:hypothetical protein